MTCRGNELEAFEALNFLQEFRRARHTALSHFAWQWEKQCLLQLRRVRCAGMIASQKPLGGTSTLLRAQLVGVSPGNDAGLGGSAAVYSMQTETGVWGLAAGADMLGRRVGDWEGGGGLRGWLRFG